MKIRYVISSLLFIFISLLGIAQEIDIESVLDSTRLQMLQIESYSVDATFKVDIDFVNMPDKTASIHFQAPDKLDIKSKGFLMIPKMGMKPLTKQLNLDKYHALYLGEELINGKRCYIVKMIPKDRKSRIVLSTIWINTEDYLVTRWEAFTKKAGNIIVDLEYNGLVLPSVLVFSFEVSEMNIPVKYFGNEVEIDKNEMKNSEVQQGKVYITFDNYYIKYSAINN